MTTITFPVAVASADDTKHPYYRTAMQILHKQGLRPRGVRGSQELAKLLAEYDANPKQATKAPAAAEQAGNHAAAQFRQQRADAMRKLAALKRELKSLLSGLPAEEDRDEETEEHLADLQATIQQREQYIAGLNTSIENALKKKD